MKPEERSGVPTSTFKTDGRVLEIVPGCIICKTCEFHSPEVFILKEKSLTAEVVMQPKPEHLKDVLEAIKMCPEHVIKFRKCANTASEK